MTIRRVIVTAAALFLPALLLGAFSGEVQKAAFELAFDAGTGAKLTVAGFERHGGTTVLRDVSLVAAGGDATFHAASVTIARAGGQARLDVVSPSIAIHGGRDTVRRLRGLRNALAFTGSKNIDASVSGGSIAISRDDDSAPPFTLDAFTGTIDLQDGVAAVDGSAVESANDGKEYPLVFSGGHVRAALLPAQPLFALLPPSAVHITGGFVHDLDVAFTAGISGSIGVSALQGEYNGHLFSGLHGTVLFDRTGIASRAIDGSIDNLPLQLAGEVYDVRNWNDALRNGTPNLRALARVYDMISSTPNLRWIRLETTAPGVAFGQYAMQLDDLPRVVQLVTIDPHRSTLRFDTALSGNHLISGGERTSQMGIRTHAVAGLNGDYFDIARTYQPQGMLIENGRLLRGPTNREALIVDRHNNVSFAEFHLRGQVQIGNRTLRVTQYNDWPLGYVTVITPDFGSALPPVPGVRFLSLQYVRGNRYRVTAVDKDGVPSPLRFGIALGPDVKNLRLPAPGDVISLNYSLDPPVRGAVAGIGGGPLLLRDGKWFEDPDAPAPDERDVRWPVDALGVLSDRTLIMVAVDGRHPERSAGMTRPEFGKLLQDLGVTDAMALDSGGSVTLVARSPGDSGVTLHNVPSDDSAERYVSNGIFVYSSAPQGTLLENTSTAEVSKAGS